MIQVSEHKSVIQFLKKWALVAGVIYACLIMFDFAYVKVTGQSPQQTLTVVTYSNIVSTSKLDGCFSGYPCIDNRSQFTRQSSTSSYRAIGTGTWSVDMQWADVTPTGWTSFGSTAQVSNVTPPSGIGYGIGPSVLQKPYHDYIRFVMTGNVTILNYSGTRQFWWLPSVAAVAFPITPTQGGGTDYSVTRFGATCDGITDDTTAWQAAFSSMGQGIRVTGCAISAVHPNVLYIPSTAAGSILEGLNSGVNATDTGQYSAIGGMIALSGTGPMVRVFAPNINIRNFPIHCNSTATVGWQYSAIGEAVIENSGADYCTGDANQINAFGGSSTTLTSSIPSGSTIGYSFTVTNASLTGQILGTPGCNQISVDYNTSHWELFEAHRSGNTLTIYVGTASFTHNIGEDVRCEGNNDGAKFINAWGKYSGGWGFDIMEGSDNNTLEFSSPYMAVNTLGGMLASGSINGIVGGHFEGNGGPAVQLGDLNGTGATGTSLGRFNVATRITGILDMEGNGTNAVVAICDIGSYISQLSPDRTVFNPGAAYCPALPGGSSTVADSPGRDSNGNPNIIITTINGSTTIGVCGSISLAVCQGGTVSKDTSGNIVPVPGVFTKTSTSGASTVYMPPNFIPSSSETGSNNAIAFALKDAYTGANVTFSIATNGMTIPVALAHTLAASPTVNTVTINGTPYNISNPCNPTANTLPHAWTANSILNLRFNNNVGNFIADNGGC